MSGGHPNDGSGGDEQVETPPAEGAAPPPPAAVPAADPKLDELQKQLNQLQQTNQQLVGFIQQNIPLDDNEQPQQPKAPAQRAAEVDPEVQQYVETKLGSVALENRMLQDQLDKLQFYTQVQAAGADPELAAKAEQLYGEWQRTGFRTMDGKGRQRVPGRLDALRIVAGDHVITTGAKAAPERSAAQLRQMLGVEAPTGGGFRSAAPANPALNDLDAKPLDVRLKVRAEALDKEGF